MFRDDYTDFYFNNLSSRNFKVWITNSNDLQINFAPSFSDTFTSPSFTQSRYYEGTKIEKQDIQVKMAAIGVTKQEWRAITEWLSPLASGPLVFSWNKQHYYMMKIASAPSGIMWANDRVDNIVEATYNITFTINFTTVGDWAALGETAYIPLNIGAADYLRYIPLNSSERFKNNYHIPYLLSINSNKWNISTGVTLETGTGTKTINKEMVKDSPRYLYYTSSNMVQKIQVDNNKLQVLTYPLGNPSDFIIQNLEDDTFSFNVDYGIFYYTKLDNVATLNNVLLCNPGSFSLYPSIVTNYLPFQVSCSGKEIVNITKAEIGPQLTGFDDNSFFEYEGKSGFASYRGQLLQNVRINGIKVFDKINSTPFVLESGHPEILKVIVDSVEKYDLLLDYNIPISNIFYKAKFKCTKPFSYSRDKGYVVTIFNNWPLKSNVYDIDKYNSNKYYETNFDYFITLNPSISFVEKDNGLYLELIFTNNCFSNNLNYGISDLSMLENLMKKYCFISICDYEEMQINLPNDQSNEFMNIAFQTRDVI